MKVEYEEYPPILSTEAALAPDAAPLHPDVRENNILGHNHYQIGEKSYDEVRAEEPDLMEVTGIPTDRRISKPYCHLRRSMYYDEIIILCCVRS